MLDWITLTIELVGAAILLMWIVIPIREFRQILQIVRHKPRVDHSRRGHPVEGDAAPRREDGPLP